MKNREYYAKEILDLVCSGKQFAVDKMGKVVPCISLATCSDCLFDSEAECAEGKKEWSEATYKEPVTTERLQKEFNVMCGITSCSGCKYRPANCNYGWLLDHYNVTEKE